MPTEIRCKLPNLPVVSDTQRDTNGKEWITNELPYRGSRSRTCLRNRILTVKEQWRTLEESTPWKEFDVSDLCNFLREFGKDPTGLNHRQCVRA
eukprot:COSAG04_NODE_25877_length_302_cov_0.763547_1_plen_93_part_01